MADRCPACGTHASEPAFSAKDYEHGVPGEWRIVRCLACGLYFQEPMPRADQLGAFYPPAYSAYNSNTFISLLFRFVYWLDARRIRSLIGASGRVLDVGCGNGNALAKLRESGGTWQLNGVEIDRGAVSKARARGLDVQQGELVDCDLPEGAFDLIRMGHVIEHVPDPAATLRKAYRLLCPGGILLGETPNTDCLDFRLFGKYWGALHVPRHLTFFNSENLTASLKGAGFSEISIRPRMRTVGWSAAIQNWLADKGAINVPPTGRVSWYALLIVPFLPVTALQSLSGRTGTVAFIAKRSADVPAANQHFVAQESEA
jgi:SAM-dependent methyltransferase